MYSLKVMALVVCVLIVVPMAIAGEDLGIRESGKIDFTSPTRVAGTLLPAGEYLVRHTMEGQEHVMVFQSVNHKVQDVKVKVPTGSARQKGRSNQDRVPSERRQRTGAAGTRVFGRYSQARLLAPTAASPVVARCIPCGSNLEAVWDAVVS
jgi:hypothetical protein